MRPPRRARVQAICKNINERIKLAAEFRVLAGYCPKETEARDTIRQAEVIEAQVEVMRDTLYALFARAVIDSMLLIPEKNGEIQEARA